MTVTTSQTLTVIRAVAALDFQPLGRADRACYAGAGADALIAHPDATIVRTLIGGEVEEGEGSCDVLISGERVELYACRPDGEPVVIHWTVGEGF